MNVDNMSWEEMKQLVERRLNRLAMCKRGTLATDISNMKEKLGPQPRFTEEERKEIDKALAPKVKKAMTPTPTDMKKFAKDGSLHILNSRCTQRAQKILDDRYKHPGVKKWNEEMSLINLQAKEREASLDGEFQEVMDQFLIGEITISKFIEVYAELEAREW